MEESYEGIMNINMWRQPIGS